MKPQRSLYFLIFIVLILPACIPGRPTLDADLNTSAPVLQIVTPMPSATVFPTQTATLQPVPTATLIPPATLEPEQAEDAIQTLLQGSVDCVVPCFWGITPGKTTLGEAINVVTHFGLQLKYVNTLDSNEFYESQYDFNDGLSVSSNYKIQDGVIESVRVYIDPEKQKKGTPREWSAYSPETLVNRYGLPSKVDLFLDRGPLTSFMMDIYFDNVDLIVRYYIFDLRAKVQICPLSDQFESVHIWMGKNPSISPPHGVSLEYATSLTMEKFSKLMTGNRNKACFNLKVEKFP